MGQDNAVKHCKLNYDLYILKIIAFLSFFGFHLEAADPARKLCLDNQFIVVHPDGNKTCEDCGTCPAGQEHSHVCGGHIYANAKLVCERCPENTFSSHEDTSRCAPCSSCAEDQVVLQSCTATQDVVCDKKCSSHDRYFDESGVCLPCSKCCGDGRDKVENECKFKLGGALENACAFNLSGNRCDISTSNPTTATSNSTEMTGDATSTLNVTSLTTLPLASRDLFPSTSVPGRSTSELTPERIVIIVLVVLLSIFFVTLFVKARGKCNHLHGGNSDVEAGQSKTEMLSETKGKRLGSLCCRGLKPPVVRGHAAAFTYWFNVFGHSGPYSQSIKVLPDGSQKVIAKGNPMNSPAVKQTIKQLVRRSSRPTRMDAHQGRVAYEPKKAPPFTLYQLMRIREYCLKTIEGMRGLWLWTVTIFSFALFLRGEEPLRLKLRHLKLPQNYAANSGRMPQRIEVKIPWSKADKKAKGVTLSLWANSLKRELCPVTALFTWLLITGITKGQNYIFPRVAKNNRAVLPNCARGVTTYRKTFLETSNILFGKDFTTHSIRRSAARWAARCGANDSSIKRAGRWKSNSFELYTQDARAEMIKEHHDGQPVSDHKMWMFKPLR